MAMCLSALSVAASEDGPMDIVVDQTSVEYGATEATVNISIPNNPGMALIRFKVNYDNTAMTLDSAILGNIFTGDLECNLSAFPFVFNVYTGSANKEDSGTLVTLNFKLNADCEAKQYDITIDGVKALNIDEEEIDCTINNGGIAVGQKESIGGMVTDKGNEETPTPQPEDEDKTKEENGITKEDETKEEEKIEFSDTKGHWAEEYISEAVKLGLFKGTGENTFTPDAYITRAQFITTLWRMSGAPKIEATASFVDIFEQSLEFRSAISWGQDKGYISGITETEFSPNGSLTREAAMKILYYYAGGQSGNEMLLTAVYDGTFVDSNEISSWAKPCVYWGVYNKLIKGISKNEISPKGVVTRAQLAKILVDYNHTLVEW